MAKAKHDLDPSHLQVSLRNKLRYIYGEGENADFALFRHMHLSAN